MDINVIKSKLLVQYPLFGSVLAKAKIISDDSVSTACTDGEYIYYNPKFLSELSVDEQVFVIAHEICHIAFEHIIRSKDKDSRLWNIATDSVVNALLQRDGLPLIEGGVDIPEAINYNAEAMYEKLLKEQQKNKENKSSNSSDKQSNNGQGDEHNGGNDNDQFDKNQENVGHDDHSMWKDAVKKMENNNNQDTNNVDEKKFMDENSENKKDLLEKIKKQLVNKSVGHDSNSNNITLDNIGTSKSLINWKVLLREATRYTEDWSYQNAVIEDGVLTAKLEKLYEPETEILLDTSGSIDEELLKNFLRECKNIIKTSKVKVGCFDTKFYGFNEIKNVKDIDKLPFLGGGGTDFDVAVNAFSKKAQNKIIFTDGYSFMPKKSVDAIWVVFGYDKINPKGGKVIYIDERQLSDLYNLGVNEKTSDGKIK